VDEHLSAEWLEAYVRRALPATEVLAADDHLASCEACRARLSGDPAAALARLRTSLDSGRPDHPAHEELAAYVDGALGDVEKEILETHLEGCGPCAAEAGGLRDVRAELRPHHEYRPSPRPVAVAGAAPRWRPVLQIAAAVVLVALAAWYAAGLRRGVPPREARESIAPTAPVAGLTDGGRRIALDDHGRVTGLESFPSAVQERVAAALASGRVVTADDSLVGSRGQLMGPTSASSAFGPVSPVGGVIESARPMLRWRALPGASRYQVMVLAADLTPVAESPALRTTEWTPPRPLERGRSYTWQVSAQVGERRALAPAPPEPDARFRVLDAPRAQALADARGRGESHLVLGVLYAEGGLVEEARVEMSALVGANPGSTLARGLLASLPGETKTDQLPSPTSTKPAQ
jgi:anti-sigma factor RsiW